jgi:hemerythrin-like domain-containing protein
VQALHNEHIYMFNLLDSLSEQVALIVSGGDADYNLLLDIVDYMQNFPDRYHHPKEDLIYQRMALRDDDIARDVFALLDEHRVLHKLSISLAEAINDVHDMPTVLKKERAGELCAQYEACLRQHINIEEAKILPRALEVLREEDWFLIEQNSIPINEIPIDNILTDNYVAARRLLRGNTEKLANNLVLAEFLGSQTVLEMLGALGATIEFGQRACVRGTKQGWQAYWSSLQTWIPLRKTDGRGAQNPVSNSWRAFWQGAALHERPDIELLAPTLRALKLYAALIGGRGRAVRDRQDKAESAEDSANTMEFLAEMARVLQ